MNGADPKSTSPVRTASDAEPGARGTTSSVAGPEDSLLETAGSRSLPTDSQSLRQLVLAQQQRIEFLESVHQQSLKQLKKVREELAVAQQLRFKEADKALGLEQLITEMQAQRFEGDAQLRLSWENWLQRSRAILRDE